MTILELDGVTLAYGSVVAVEDVSLKIDSGDFACITGANGSGKSTLLKAVLGLVPLTRGTIRMEIPREKAAYVPQAENAERDFPASVREVVLTGAQRTGRRFPLYTEKDRAAVERSMKRFEIAHLAEKQIGALSGGQYQRVMLARAMCRDPEILFLDEPCAGLDEEAGKDFRSLLAKLHGTRKVTIVMVTHDPDEIETFATRVVVLARKLLFCGDTGGWRLAKNSSFAGIRS